jgi:hypothetical protein
MGHNFLLQYDYHIGVWDYRIGARYCTIYHLTDIRARIRGAVAYEAAVVVAHSTHAAGCLFMYTVPLLPVDQI